MLQKCILQFEADELQEREKRDKRSKQDKVAELKQVFDRFDKDGESRTDVYWLVSGPAKSTVKLLVKIFVINPTQCCQGGCWVGGGGGAACEYYIAH